MLLAWKSARILTMAGYIIGFPNDTPESVRRDIEIIKKELPVDFLEFTILTPLPGSEDHKVLFDNQIFLQPDLNKYDVEQVCFPHPKMAISEWEEAYNEAWRSYYSSEHSETIMRRAKASGMIGYGLLLIMLWFVKTTVSIERVHPMQGGVLRLKHPSERRPGLPIEPALRFYPSFVIETLVKQIHLFVELLRIGRIALRVALDQRRRSYSDLAMIPIGKDELERLRIFVEEPGSA